MPQIPDNARQLTTTEITLTIRMVVQEAAADIYKEVRLTAQVGAPVEYALVLTRIARGSIN
jgi:hypothetical protein